MYPPSEIHPCPKGENCPSEAMINRQDLMIANNSQRKFTIIQSNFGGFFH